MESSQQDIYAYVIWSRFDVGEHFTISDIFTIIHAIFHIPGNLIISKIAEYESARTFLELSPDILYSWVTAIISLSSWLALFYVTIGVLDWANGVNK